MDRDGSKSKAAKKVRHNNTKPTPADLVSVHTALSGLVLAPNISQRAVTVGGALLRHFNRKNGRCDPSKGTLAKGIGCSLSTVDRGLKELCSGKSPYFTRITHGSSYGRNLYIPNFDRICEHAQVYDLQSGICKEVKTSKPCQGVKRVTGHPLKCRPLHRVTSKPIEKTNLKNQGKEAWEKEGYETFENAAVEKKISGKPKRELPTPNLAIRHEPISQDKSSAMKEAAQRRMSKSIGENNLQHLYRVLEQDPNIGDEAIALEIKRKGSGVPFLQQIFNHMHDD